MSKEEVQKQLILAHEECHQLTRQQDIQSRCTKIFRYLFERYTGVKDYGQYKSSSKEDMFVETIMGRRCILMKSMLLTALEDKPQKELLLTHLCRDQQQT